MARTQTTSIALGFQAPEFLLPDSISGQEISLNDIKGVKGTLVIFMCNHCPFVVHVIHELVRLGNDYLNSGINIVAINSNDVENYPDDSPEKMKHLSQEIQIPFPYLFDESQEVAKAYDASCTPDFSVFDGAMKCIYRGQLDGSRPGNDVLVDGRDIRMVFEALLSGQEVAKNQMPSIGCNIKWKK